jgi:hypothetical protein
MASKAFREQRETDCERLGALHLLSHGVWAFKVDAQGGRSDLVLNEPLSSSLMVERAADVLVLTEWKKVSSEAKLTDRIEEAPKQAEIYSTGILGGIELANYRYIVLISEGMMDMPEDSLDGTVTYRHMNIAVNPKTPSVEARSH